MNSAILQIASKYVRTLMVILAIIILWRGHNLPGGGFIGGLLAGLSIAYKGFAFTPDKVRVEIRWKPPVYMALGLLLIFLSTLPGWFSGKGLMAGIWVTIPFTGGFKLGTPFLFDIGVFFAVIGVTLLFLLSLTRGEEWK